MDKSLTIKIAFLTGFLFGSELQVFSGDIIQLDFEALGFRDCPGLVDSCIYVCSDGNTNPCHPENIYAIVVDSSTGDTVTLGSRFRIHFPWEYAGMTADKFTITASWPCLSPTAVFASGDYSYFDVIGHEACPGTVQASIWYGDDCQDEDGNIGADYCLELVGRFCFAPGDTLDWPENSDQSISTDTCNACWMSLPAWQYYDGGEYADPLLSPGDCEAYDHCHHDTPDSIQCGEGYLDGETAVSIIKGDVPSRSSLYPGYPNPFNPVTTIRFDIPISETLSATSLHVFDLNGRMVVSLMDEMVEPGNHDIKWDASNFSSGIYFVRLISSSKIHTQKLILIK